MNDNDKLKIVEQERKIDFHRDKLDDDNWTAWRWHMETFISARNLFHATSQDVDDLTNTLALTYISDGLTKKIKNLVVGCIEAKQVWNRLETVYGDKLFLLLRNKIY